MMIVGPLLTILTLLLPWILKWVEEQQPKRARREFDALLLNGDPLAVATDLSRVFDEAGGRVAGEPNADLPGAGTKTL